MRRYIYIYIYRQFTSFYEINDSDELVHGMFAAAAVVVSVLFRPVTV